MKYKNITNGVLSFRAHNAKGVKQVFNLNPDKEMESDREVRFGGLVLVNETEKAGKGKTNKTKKGDD